MVDAACHSSDTPAFSGQPVTQVAEPVRTDNRLVPVQEQRIADAALGVLGAIVGAADVNDDLAKLIAKLLAPTANRLTRELRAAGYRLGRDDEGHRA